jgi:large conductance mechanosensitive channel
MSGFKKFLMRGNIIDLAVAVVIGVAFNDVIKALVSDLITPLISAAGGKVSFDKLTFIVGKSKFSYGLFLNELVAFLIVAAVVYFLLLAPMAKLTALTARDKAATDRECPECLSQIPVGARRCMYCTAEVPPVQPPATDVPQPRRARHGYLASESE